jgi:hypothetical protein
VGKKPIVDRADDRSSVMHNPTVLGISLASLLSNTGHEMADGGAARVPAFHRRTGRRLGRY